jgi:hypothetical protein
MAFSNLAHLNMESHEADAAVAWARRAIELAEPWEHGELLVHALTIMGTARLIAGDAGGWDDLVRTLEIARSRGSQEEVARSYSSLSAMAISRRQYADAARYQEEGIAFCEARDLDSWWLYILAGRARMRFEQGKWLEAADDVEAVLRHPRATPITRIPALEVLGHMRIRRGDPGADSALSVALTLAGPQPGLQRIGRIAAAQAEAAWLAGDRGRSRRGRARSAARV